MLSSVVKIGGWVAVLFFLILFSCWDIRSKQLPVRWLWMSCLFSAGYAVLRAVIDNSGIRMVGEGVLPGILFIVLAAAAKGKVGIGDGMVLLIIGNLTGLKSCLLIFAAAILLSFGYSCVLMVFFGKNEKYSFPFVPFYLAGAVSTGIASCLGTF